MGCQGKSVNRQVAQRKGSTLQSRGYKGESNRHSKILTPEGTLYFPSSKPRAAPTCHLNLCGSHHRRSGTILEHAQPRGRPPDRKGSRHPGKLAKLPVDLFLSHTLEPPGRARVNRATQCEEFRIAAGGVGSCADEKQGATQQARRGGYE